MRLLQLFTSLLLVVIAPSLQASQCMPIHFDESVVLDYVNDGDTLTLQDGRRVRLIGVDAPEIDFKSSALSQSYAVEAKSFLQSHLKPGQTLKLAFDQRKLGPYGRTLAYVYTEQGEHLQELLLANGFAKSKVFQNDMFWQCLADIETVARRNNIGLWQHQDYKVRAVETLSREDSNRWLEIRGVVTGYERKGQLFELIIDEKLVLMITKQDISKFDNILNLKLLQSPVLVRGKVYFSYSKWRLNGTHPSQITVEKDSLK
ncbi:nuclease [Shewanella sp. c952]|uniref:thermonuclease family protein n=1 Tax=Shewanella sp. c952 TaxID=2815913 RepID=UPI001BBCE177|nr:thermonuclease family protein [Shewanella sp. c952]GIU08125.1 nuclease [Shewanella sp. c952]